MNKSLFVFISGTAGVGKNTVINEVIKNDTNKREFLLSHTSREKREDDKKNQYHFVSKDEFENMIHNSEILEYDEINGNYYGISNKEINRLSNTEKIILKDLSVKGVLNAKVFFNTSVKYTSVFLTEKKSVLRQRLMERNYDKKQTNARLKLYNYEQKHAKFYDYIIINNNLEHTKNFMEAIINTENNDLFLNTLVNPQQVLEKHIEKVVKKLEHGKATKPIEVTAINNELYIVKDINTYLAHLKTHKKPTYILTYFNDIKPINEYDLEWKKITKLYKQ